MENKNDRNMAIQTRSKKIMDDGITGDDSAGATLLNSSSGVLGNVANYAVGIADKMISPSLETASNTLFKGYQNETFKKIAPNIAAELNKNTIFINNIAKDPIVRAALIEYINSLGIVVETVAELAKPVIDEAVNDAWEAIDEAGERSVIGATNTGLNLFKAAVAEIPIVGGIIDLGLAGAQAFNYTTAAARPLIISGTKNLALVSQAASKASGEISDLTNNMESAKNKLTNALDQVKNKPRVMSTIVNSSKNNASEQLKKTRKKTINNVQTGINRSVRNTITGGRRARTKRTEKRVKKSISRFTCNPK